MILNFKEFINESKSEDFVRFSVYKDVVYHGTWKSFDKFRISTRGSYGKGFYFTSSEMSAYKYGNIIKRCLVDIRNPYYLTEDVMSEWGSKYYNHNKKIITSKLQKDGYDSIIIDDGYEIVVFDNDKILIL